MQRLVILFAACVLCAAWVARSQALRDEIDSAAVVSARSPPDPSNDQAEAPEHFFLRGEQYGTDDDYEGYWSQPNAGELPEVILLSRGNREYRAGETAPALEAWREVIARHPNTPAWNMAILNAGGALQESGRHAEAIATLNLLVSDTANFQRVNSAKWLADEQTDSTPMDSYLDPWNNDWYDASKAISASFEALHDLESAQAYNFLARHKFYYRSTCGLAGASEYSQLNDRITDLAGKLHAPLEIAYVVLSVAAAALVVWLAVHFINRRQWRRAIGSALAAAALLVAYPLSFGPACWIAAGSPVCTRLVSTVYFPILRCATRSREAAAIAMWYARLSGPDHSIPAFDGDELNWWEFAGAPAETAGSDAPESLNGLIVAEEEPTPSDRTQ